MRILSTLCCFLLASVLCSAVRAQANEAEAKQIKFMCAGQIAAMVQSAHEAPGDILKKVIFNDTVDAEYLSYFKQLKTMMQTAQSKPSPDKETAQKINAVYEKISALSQKVASKEVGICIDWMGAQFEAVKKVCPNFEKDMAVPEKANACNEKASQTPEVKGKFEKWMDVQKALSMKKK